ncbi:type II toxin-antitoxin system death-on-curing family toxin [Conexibacter woesei]|uniref:type II toxin-antitoxin system death-on-curing family toxin n=1 Tax=Conexibacter woesei TaxID=191495 RepID=UPI0003FA75FB|nr:Fic family protein [Conexibacter woesei]
MAPPRWRPTLEDYIDLAAFLLAASPEAVRRLPRMGSAESAINAPFASFEGQEPYPELHDQAAVLIAHLVQNHPLPDGNKRSAFLLTARFLDANGLTWAEQDTERDASMVERIAARDAQHEEIVGWLRARTK